MIPLLIPLALGAARATLGAVQANQTRQKNKGLISQAYARGRQRLDLTQQDTRQSVTEGLLSRGLGAGGSVAVGGAVAPGVKGAVPGVTGAHDLGGQAVADLRREQGLSQNDLATQRDNAQRENRAAGTNAIVGSIAGGAQTALSAASGMQDLAAARGAGGAGGIAAGLNPATASMSAATQAGGASTAWGGINPVDPLRGGAWGAPSVASFNVVGGGNF